MTSERIRELRGLCDGATLGPWEWDEGVLYCNASPEPLWDRATIIEGSTLNRVDARFIAASRTALPEALDAIESLRAERDALRGLLRRWMDGEYMGAGSHPLYCSTRAAVEDSR